MRFTEEDKLSIKNLVAEKEAVIACEIVPMIVQASSNYPAAHFRMAIIVSFIFSLGLYYSPLSILNPIYFLWIQIPGLLAGYFLASIPFFKRLFTTKTEMDREVTQQAHEAFIQQNLHMTVNHNGLLIFISQFERKIKIVTDNGISSKIDNQVWANIIKNFITIVKNENLLIALKATIRAVAEILEKNFPSQESKINELKNDLIIE